MTCRGYDAKAVKLPKAIKRFAAYQTDKHERGDTLKSYTKIFETELRSNKRSPKEK
jgi:hypothetical protein